jgi:hypothetical protein
MVPRTTTVNAQRLPFSLSSVLDWFHISMRVRYLEQIVKGMRATTESEKAARRVLVSRIAKLRWSFGHVARVRCVMINGDLVQRLARFKFPEPSPSSEAAEFIKVAMP